MSDLSHGHEHEFEAAPGLPEPLLYFVAILGARALNELVNGGGAADAAQAVAWLLPVAIFALGMLNLLAYLSSQSTLYTITNKRVIMRVGIVLTLTFNLPFRSIASAGFKSRSSGTGDIPLALAGKDKIAYVHLWPHARPWRVASPEPMLRCVPQAAQVAELLTQAWVKAAGGMATLGDTSSLPVQVPSGRPSHGSNASGLRTI
jgi:Bacterial PH domain